MLCITVELLDGTYRADPSGAGEAAEWPPAPSRALDALVAAGRGDKAPGWESLRHLYVMEAPEIYAAASYWQQPSEQAYMNYSATQHHGPQEVQGLAGRTAVMVRRGPTVSVGERRVVFVWPQARFPSSDLDDLGFRAARVGYLGCADSKVAMTVSAAPPPGGLDPRNLWRPLPDGQDPTGCVLVNVGSAQHLEDALRSHKLEDPRARHRARQRRSRCWYQPPSSHVRPMRAGGLCVWMQFERSLPAGLSSNVAHALKAALMRRLAGWPGGVPWWISGHGTPADGDYQLARFLVLPAVGRPHSNGRLQGACIQMPAAAEPERADMVAATLRTLGRFFVVGIGDVELAEADPDHRRRKWSTTAARWVGPARRWITALPALSDRHGFPTAADVSRWCAQAELHGPEEDAVRVSRRALITGGVELTLAQMHRPGHRSTRNFAHVSFVLREPVVGPVAVGAGRSFGLGLCVPGDDQIGRR